MPQFALGMIETRGLVAAIEAADAAGKAAEIRLLGLVKVTGGLVMLRFVGDTASVQAATEAGAQAAARIGELVNTRVIARLDDEAAQMLGLTDSPGPEPGPEPGGAAPGALAGYEAMTTSELRTIARNIPGFPIKGRELNRLPKERLIEEIIRMKGGMRDA